MSAEELKKFYESRAKHQHLFSYDDDGNLVELNKEGAVIKTIPLPNYRLPTYEEIDKMEQERASKIATANKEYDDAQRELRRAYSNPETPDSEILRINRKVKESDIKLQSIRFPLQYVEASSGIPISVIDFAKSYEKRKYPYTFYFLKERPFTLQEQYVRIGKKTDVPLISVTEAREKESNATASIVILFAEPDTNDYGFLSLKWVVGIDYNGTMYNSAHQAIYAELAKSFNDIENLRRIMMAETADEIHYSLEDVPGDANDAKWNDLIKQLIYDVNIAKFNQYPELAGRLMETKNALLGAYIPDDNLIGIGISIDNIQSKNPAYWTGQNILGKALVDIRDKLRTERNVIASQTITAVPRPIRRRAKPVVAPLSTEVPSVTT